MKNKLLFIGNRFFVLSKILSLDFNVVKIYAPKDSFLEKELRKRKIAYDILPPKDKLIEELVNEDFDILISNGCPYILPVSKIKKRNQKFINIHPSLLPDLRGIHPITGAILFDRIAGATCHYMDDGVDTGKVISQVKIGKTSNINIELLYQLSFKAEAEVFLKAYARNFVPSSAQKKIEQGIYYSRKEEDMNINLSNDINHILRVIRAFSIESQGAYFTFKNKKLKVFKGSLVTCDFFRSHYNHYKENQVVLKYGSNIVIKKGNDFLQFGDIKGELDIINEGDIL